jgi:hypothetical protein
MAIATDATNGLVPEQENRITLRDPIRESEGLFFFVKTFSPMNKR